MVWTVSTDKYYKKKDDKDSKSSWSVQKLLMLPGFIGTVIVLTVLAGGYYLLYLRQSSPSPFEHAVVEFNDKLQQVCKDPKLPMPLYKGPESFINYILNPEVDFCYSWIQFGGEKIPVANQKEEECNDEIRKEKFICFNDEYKMNLDPCLVYSFGKDLDSQFERDMHLFSCEVHAFDKKLSTPGEHLRRTEFWFEHSWDIAEYPYDLPAEENDGKDPISRRSIDFITTVLNHKGKEIKYVKSDLEGREWILLKQIVTYPEYADFRQIGVRLHMPLRVGKMDDQKRNETLYEYFKIFQGLACSGYRYVLSRPVKYYKGGIRVPEVNKTLYAAYEMNFVKDLNI